MNLNDKSGAPPTSSPSGSAVAPQEEHARKLHPFELAPLQSLDELQAKAAEMRAAARKSNGITAPSTSEAA